MTKENPSDPILPPAPARPAPQFERRSVEVSLPERPGHRHTSARTYFYIALGLGSFAVGGWFALAAYIYG